MSASVQLTKSSELDGNTGQTEGMARKGAIIDKASISASGLPLTLHRFRNQTLPTYSAQL